MTSGLPPNHPPALIAQIMEIILASPFRTVHYTGGADEGLLRALLADRERLEVTVMDVPDRWASGWRFFWEEGMGEPPDRPEWLEGVPFYQEGASDHEIALRDWPWDSLDQFDRIVAFTGCRPPKLVLLFGLADTAQVGTTRVWNYSAHDVEKRDDFEKLTLMHPAYDWETLGDLRVGRRKDGVKSAHDKREARRRKAAITAPRDEPSSP